MPFEALMGIDPLSLPASVYAANMWGYKAANFDPCVVASGTLVPSKGRLYLQRNYTPLSISATALVVEVFTAGSGLTAGQNFGCLYTGDGSLLGVTTDASTGLASAGTTTLTLASGPITIPAGYFYTGFWINGTTAPTLGRAGTTGKSLVYGNAPAATARFVYGTASGVTTTAPATLPSLTLDSRPWWVGVV